MRGEQERRQRGPDGSTGPRRESRTEEEDIKVRPGTRSRTPTAVDQPTPPAGGAPAGALPPTPARPRDAAPPADTIPALPAAAPPGAVPSRPSAPKAEPPATPPGQDRVPRR